jgi:creatinine amidohydrolase
MLLENMNWMQTEEYLKKDDRLVLVLGSTEQHGYCTLGTDTLTTWEIAKAACEQEGVVLAPALPYGPTRTLMAYPGTTSIDVRTYLDFVEQVVKGFISHGFRRILILNGHGGNKVVERQVGTFREENPDVMVKFESWYIMPKTYEFAKARGGDETQHGSWIEGFPWINQLVPVPEGEKPPVDRTDFRSLTAQEARQRLGDGMGGGAYAQDEETMRQYFQVAVEDVLDILRGKWTA